jgi:hypothetical protein
MAFRGRNAGCGASYSLGRKVEISAVTRPADVLGPNLSETLGENGTNAAANAAFQQARDRSASTGEHRKGLSARNVTRHPAMFLALP